MIVTYSKHGRIAKDSQQLVAHLLKSENDAIDILGIGNSVAPDLAGVVRDMEILRNGSSAKAAFHHFSLNPSIDYPKEQLLAAADALRAEFDPDGTRPWIVVAHQKPRQNSEKGHLHAHLVLGHADGEGRSLKDGRAKVRTEIVARTLEYQAGEMPVLSPHHLIVVKFLRERGWKHVANWLVAAHGAAPDKPRSAYGSKARQAAKRRGINLPQAKGAVASAWSETSEIEAFQTKLATLGYRIEPGKKEDVWIVVDKGGNTIGSLDRLLKLKRHVAKNLVEKQDGQIKPRSSAANDRPRQKALRKINGDCREDRSAESSTISTTSAGRPIGSGPSRSHYPAAGAPGYARPAPEHGNAGAQFQTRRAARYFRRLRAIVVLRQIGRAVAAVPLSSPAPREHLTRLPQNWEAKDIWGLPLPPI